MRSVSVYALLLAFVLAYASVRLCEAADQTYVCEIVDAAKVDMLDASENSSITVAKNYKFTTSSTKSGTESDDLIDLDVYQDSSPNDPHFTPVQLHQAQVKKGVGAPNILWLVGSATIECKNQSSDALTWSARAAAVLAHPMLRASHLGAIQSITEEIARTKSLDADDLHDFKLHVPSGQPQKFQSPF